MLPRPTAKLRQDRRNSIWGKKFFSYSCFPSKKIFFYNYLAPPVVPLRGVLDVVSASVAAPVLGGELVRRLVELKRKD